MELKKIIIILGITITLVIGIMFGISYAWYAYSNAETTLKGSTLKEAPTIIFSQTEYINSKITMPIKDDDRYNYANKNSFMITIEDDLREYETGIEILLKDIVMSNDLKNKNYKYELLQDNIVVSTGNFSNIGSSNNMIIMPMTVLKPNAYPKTYNYELYIWLSDDGTDQNNLMNKEFKARIGVNSATKK